jgi:hypothetical protein
MIVRTMNWQQDAIVYQKEITYNKIDVLEQVICYEDKKHGTKFRMYWVRQPYNQQVISVRGKNMPNPVFYYHMADLSEEAKNNARSEIIVVFERYWK